ncbi:MAG: D-lyxose/D-mannose family sugar isomerase [Verrucomicrobiae bacterium]|nr:D-lyxose/D-mannose family sugar isomerase [Verrucomicrobiae bacterium]
MKRSEINRVIARALACFQTHGWALPPSPQWDVTDFGLGDFSRCGAVLVNLTLEKEYSEKLIYLTCRQTIPCHGHRKKKEDVIARFGAFSIQVWFGDPKKWDRGGVLQINNKKKTIASGAVFHLIAGERVTLEPGVYHAFWALGEEAILGEVSTKNDDLHDNFFTDPKIGRFPAIEEDEPPLVRLTGERTSSRDKHAKRHPTASTKASSG